MCVASTCKRRRRQMRFDKRYKMRGFTGIKSETKGEKKRLKDSKR